MNQQVDFVEQIHSVLAVRYGAGWAKMWQGLDMAYVRADWARVLREYEAMPSAITHALDNLPVGPRPPTSSEFLQLCAAAPRPAMRLVPRSGVKPSEQQVAVLNRVRSVGGGNRRERALQGWQRVMQRIEAGEVVTPTIRRWAQEMCKRDAGSDVEHACQ